MKAAHAAGVAVAPRGASMSYTSSHVPAVANTLSLDLTRRSRVVAIRPQDMTVLRRAAEAAARRLRRPHR